MFVTKSHLLPHKQLIRVELFSLFKGLTPNLTVKHFIRLKEFPQNTFITLRFQLWGPYSKQFIFFVSKSKLVCFIAQGWKGLPETNTTAYWPICDL